MHSAAEKCNSVCTVHFAMRGVQFAVFTLYTYSVCSTAQCTMHTAVLQYNDATEADVTGAASGALQIAWRGLTLEVGGSLVLFSYSNVCNIAIQASPSKIPWTLGGLSLHCTGALVLKHGRLFLVGCLHCKVLRVTSVPSLCHLVPVSVSLSLKPNACTTSFQSLIFLW